LNKKSRGDKLFYRQNGIIYMLQRWTNSGFFYRLAIKEEESPGNRKQSDLDKTKLSKKLYAAANNFGDIVRATVTILCPALARLTK